jgi:biotin-dependent carboxylase-like uncharacterized protein
VIEVRDAGPLTTVQDRGRPGFAHLGVPRAGAADRPALDLANRLVGNQPSAAGLESTLAGPLLHFCGPSVVAVTGARCLLTVGGVEVPLDTPVAVRPGDEVHVGPATRGLRSYLAVRGGLDVAPVLGSRSTCTLSSLGPLPLRPGDVLPVGRLVAAAVADPVPSVLPADEVVLQVRLGPRDAALSSAGLATLLGATWTVSERSDRTGLRLTGPVLERVPGGEPLSEGLVAGSVQVPPDGAPVLFLRQHPTTGGYPVVAVVADVSPAAQLRPGDRLRLQR